MSNQRATTKKSIGGYLDIDLKRRIKESGFVETQFVEFCTLLGLLQRKCITPKDVERMHFEERIYAESYQQLKAVGALPAAPAPRKRPSRS